MGLVDVKEFPILGTRPRVMVPWSFVEQGRKQAMINHDQTLERLADRGGLAWGELFMSLAGERYSRLGGYPDQEKARVLILQLLERPDRDSLKPAEVWALGISAGVIRLRGGASECDTTPKKS